MRFIQPISTLRVQINIIMLQYHRFGNGGIQCTIGPYDGYEKSAKIHKNGYRDEDIKPFEIGSGCLFVHGVKVISNNEFLNNECRSR